MLIQAANNTAGVTIKGLDRVVRHLKKADARTDKALNTAIKVEAFRLKKLLQKEIRAGRPGGKSVAPLSYIARRKDRQVKTGGGTTARQSPNRKPLARLAMGVKYNVSSYKPFVMKVGFVTPTGRTRSSKQGTWRTLAREHQEGFTSSISKNLRQRIIEKGGLLGKIDGGSTPFFLRKSTRTFTTPARPIMAPFWAAHKRSVNRNIKRNFALKMKGRELPGR